MQFEKNVIVVFKRSARQQYFSGNNEKFHSRNTEATAPLVLSEALAESFKRTNLVSTVVLLVGLANKAGNRVHCPLVMFMTSRD